MRSRTLTLALAGALTLAGCGGVAAPLPPSDADVAAAFRLLHQRVYRVYQLPNERDALHEWLANSFAGEALTGEYVEHWSTRQRMEQERTRIDVLRVDYERVTVLARAAASIEVLADWSVGGVVSHQQHKHPRINRYRARYRLALPAGAAGAHQLRIVESNLQSLERVGTPALSSDALPTSPAGFLSMEELLRSGVLDEQPQGEPGARP